MERLCRMKTPQKFAAAHGTVHNHFNQERHPLSRDLYLERRSTALAEWRTTYATRLNSVPNLLAAKR
jgi:putative transposase